MAHDAVLIVDHEDSARRRVRTILQPVGYDVIEASTADQALSLAKHHQPSAILLEVILPGMDGWGLARQLKSDSITCSIPIVVVSFLRPDTNTYPCEITDYLTKPYTDRQLIDATQRAVRTWRTHGPFRVLIADDESDTVDMLSLVFRQQGFVTLAAKDGAEAIDCVRRDHPDAVILDVMMPHMDGWEALKLLKQDEQLRDIPVVMVTGYALSPQDVQTALAMGAARYVTKPFDPDTVVSEVASVLA